MIDIRSLLDAKGMTLASFLAEQGLVNSEQWLEWVRTRSNKFHVPQEVLEQGVALLSKSAPVESRSFGALKPELVEEVAPKTPEPVATTETLPVVTETEPVATVTEPLVTVPESVVTVTEPVATETAPVVTEDAPKKPSKAKASKAAKAEEETVVAPEEAPVESVASDKE